MDQGHKQVQRVHSAGTNQELIERYSRWASEYEVDMIQGLGYSMPEDAVCMLTQYVPSSARILDAGAGTGLVGQVLSDLGYQKLVAIDLSSHMLAEAKKKNVYQELYQMILGKTLDFATNSFDATICIGTFTVGHAPAHAFNELVRVTKPDGYIVFTLPEHLAKEGDFKEQQEFLSRSSWKLVQVTEPFLGLPKGDIQLLYQIWVYQVKTDA